MRDMGVLRVQHTPTCSTERLGTRETTFGKPCFSEFVHYIYTYGAFATSKLGAAVSGCLRRVRISKNGVFLRRHVPVAANTCTSCCVRLPPAGQNPEKGCLFVNTCTSCRVRLPPAGQNPEKRRLFAKTCTSCCARLLPASQNPEK